MTLEQQMLRIRLVELEIAKRYGEKRIRQPVHLSIGQEAAAVGVCAALKPTDQVVSTHRGHAHYLAKGGSLNGLIAELYGRSTGCSRGHGGSMHLVDRSCGFLASTSIVAGTVPVGVGVAWAKKLSGESGTVVVFLGDAAIEQGVFHEAANFAGLHKLQVLFVVENNGLSCYTPLALRQPKRSLRMVAQAHGLQFWCAQLQDDVHKIKYFSNHLLTKLPAMLEIKTERLCEHCGPKQEKIMEPWPDDPVIIAEIAEAFRLAEASPDPVPVGMYAN